MKNKTEKGMLVLISLVAVIGFASAGWDTFGHQAAELGPGTFDGDGASEWTFPGTVHVSSLCLSGDCQSSWPGGPGGDGDWIVNGNNMYSAVSGNVGIGTSTPGVKLDVNGTISADVICLSGDCQSSWPAGGGSSVCGNGVIEVGEMCDDGGTLWGTGDCETDACDCAADCSRKNLYTSLQVSGYTKIYSQDTAARRFCQEKGFRDEATRTQNIIMGPDQTWLEWETAPDGYLGWRAVTGSGPTIIDDIWCTD